MLMREQLETVENHLSCHFMKNFRALTPPTNNDVSTTPPTKCPQMLSFSTFASFSSKPSQPSIVSVVISSFSSFSSSTLHKRTGMSNNASFLIASSYSHTTSSKDVRFQDSCLLHFRLAAFLFSKPLVLFPTTSKFFQLQNSSVELCNSSCISLQKLSLFLTLVAMAPNCPMNQISSKSDMESKLTNSQFLPCFLMLWMKRYLSLSRAMTSSSSTSVGKVTTNLTCSD